MKYRVTVLTPTLVGDGNKLSPIDYMVWRDQVNVLDQPRIFRLLSKGARFDSYLTQLHKATKLDFASWGGFAQNYADRRIPFEDAAYTPYWEKAPAESLSIPTFATERAGPFLPGAAIKGALRCGFVFANVKPNALHDLAPSRRPADSIERQAVGSGGSDRMRVFAIGDSGAGTRETLKVYMLRVSTLAAKGPGQYSLGWKPAPTFAEMANPGTSFEGAWRENEFLNGPEVRQSLRWSSPMTRQRLFEAANLYAQKQLEIHAQYAAWTGLAHLTASVADLQRRLETARAEGKCLLSIGWGAGFTSKSSAIGIPDQDHRKVLGALPYYERAIKSGLPFPKTRKVVFLKNQPATLPGWVELSVT